MAGKIPDLVVQPRAGTGKGAARSARREGLVPGVVYGGGAEPMPIAIPFNILFKRLKDGGFMSTLFNLKLDGQDDVRCVCRSVQRDVVKDLPVHIDLLRLKRDSRINMHIPLLIENEDICVGLKKGGVLTMVRNDIELRVTAGDIPENIPIDIADLDIGDSITISKVTLPEGANPVIADRDFMILNVAAPTVLSAEDEEADQAAATDAAEEGAEETPTEEGSEKE